MDDVRQRKLLSAACHGAIFFSSSIVSIGIPIAILLASDDAVVKANAKEAINFYINLYIFYAIIFVLLVFGSLNNPGPILPAFLLLAIASFSLPIIAIVRIAKDPQKAYRYPFILRLL
ncbi:DUF4870 domain-containing protein [Leptolyngbya sp. FACHB-321]|uniref:DUF4870 domain-containing protein n=1 Tax=Leptolyngbya sp. FACHB-321 TaxID=2692807 RepID=UPI001684391B|nr:DUF4870 domain-containing protein [Leptolyngbya sp. FACHB-321]MBD2036798.1 DUF4870 domain-containing protein [Leptolyngbya sp. FACHB-321]